MFSAERAPAHLRRKAPGEALAVRSRWQAAGGHVQLARIQIALVSEAQVNLEQKVPGRRLALTYLLLRKANKSARSAGLSVFSRPSGISDNPELRRSVISFRNRTSSVPPCVRKVILVGVSAEIMPLSSRPF